MELQDLLELTEQPVLLGQLVQMVLPVLLEQTVPLVLLEQMVLPDLKDLLGHKDLLDHKDLQVLPLQIIQRQ
jgi:hypothetical protein